jgi:hypothetical protein
VRGDRHQDNADEEWLAIRDRLLTDKDDLINEVLNSRGMNI